MHDEVEREIGIGGNHRQVRLGQRLSGAGVGELVARGLQVADDRGQVVAGDVGDARGQAEPGG